MQPPTRPGHDSRTDAGRSTCRYPADGAAAAEVPADLAAALQQDPAGAGWRAAATAVVRDGELKCWAAFGGWLAQADAEAVIAGMLLQGMR